MDSGWFVVLRQGGPWAQFLVATFPLWPVGITALLVTQRQRLDRRLADAADEFVWVDDGISRNQAIESAASRFTASLGPFADGGLCTLLVACWWLVSLAAWLWSQATDVESLRGISGSRRSTRGRARGCGW